MSKTPVVTMAEFRIAVRKGMEWMQRADEAEALIVQAAGILALLVDGHVCDNDAPTLGDPLCAAERAAALWLQQPAVRRLVEDRA